MRGADDLPNEIVISNKAFGDGVHYWELVCPLSCAGLQMGVVDKNRATEHMTSFRTTTPRVIGVELDMIKRTLSFWANGRAQDMRNKKNLGAGPWYAAVKIKGTGNTVILNPFAQSDRNKAPYLAR